MAIGVKQYQDTINYISEMYDFFNEKLFNGELIKPVLTISPDEKNKAYGWITRDKLWKENENDEGMYEINLSAQFLNRPISETASTLIHEMSHQFARVNDFKDTARSGSFHNKLFREIAEDHGLNVELSGGRGWAVTTLKESTKRLLDGFIEQNPKTPVYRVMPIKPKRVRTDGNLTQVADSKGETVNYTYDTTTHLLREISANGESVAFTYDANQRVETILYKVGNNLIKKQFFTYTDSVTQIKETKYSDAENEAYIITCYKFDLEGKLIAAFEKDPTGVNEKILTAKYFSPDIYENYTIDLEPENCACGQYHLHNDESGTIVGCFNDLPLLNDGERYVMFAILNQEELFSGVENGQVNIYLEDSINAPSDQLPVISIDENSDFSLPFQWVELPVSLTMNGNTLFFSMVGNCNLNQELLSNIYIYKTLVSRQKECIKASGGRIAGQQHVEQQSRKATTWTEINKCILTGVNDCNHVTAVDWQLTKRNIATANEASFVVWYNDLGNAMYTSLVPTVTVNENNSYSMSVLTWETLQMENVVSMYEYAIYNDDGSVVIIQNKNVPTYSYSAACASYIDRFGRTYKTVNSLNVVIKKMYDDYDRVLHTEIGSTTGSEEVYTQRTTTQYFDTPYEENGNVCYKEEYTDEEGNKWTYVYNYNTGDLVSMTDPKEHTQKYTYDSKRRPTRVEQSTSENILAYNTNNLISSLTHDTGTYAFTYDGYQQLSGVEYNNAELLTKTYILTSAQDTESTSYSNGGGVSRVYDKYGNLLSLTDTQYNEKFLSCVYGSIMEDFENGEDITERGSENQSEVLRKKCHQNIDNAYEEVYNYDTQKRLVNITRDDSVFVDYDYDEQNRLSFEFASAGRSIDYHYQYEDGDAQTEPRISWIGIGTDNAGMSTNLWFDEFGRFVGKYIEIQTPSWWNNYINYSYQYEENKVNGRVSYFSCDIITGDPDRGEGYAAWESLTYDVSGNIATISDSNDTSTYIYDDRNRLVEEVDTKRDIRYVYVYDDGGNITFWEWYCNSTGKLLHTDSYTYITIGWRILEADQSRMTLTATRFRISGTRWYGRGEDILLGTATYTTNTTETVLEERKRPLTIR